MIAPKWANIVDTVVLPLAIPPVRAILLDAMVIESSIKKPGNQETQDSKALSHLLQPTSQKKGFCVSIVLYHSDWTKLTRTLHHLLGSISYAQARGEINQSLLVLIDNGNPPTEESKLLMLLRECGWRENDGGAHEAKLIQNGKNLGFGPAHNLAIHSHSLSFHLILNPDVYLPPEGISLAWQYCMKHPEVVLLTPATFSPNGIRQCLLRPVPNLCDVFLRFLAMSFPVIRKLRRYARYECRYLDMNQEHRQIVSMSGCFMWCRTSTLQHIGGFDPRFFLYYEDYDLSRRMAQVGQTLYYPSIKVTHDWERLIIRNWHLRYYNLRSAIMYFNKWGWKWR
jgi:GT2 family glycosyltransferase